MQYLVTGKEMKLLDQNTSERFHVPKLVLMEQAAMAFVRELLCLEEKEGRTWTRALILCGSGNNGADGLAVARLLTQCGRRVTVLACGAGRETESYRVQREICEAYGIPIRPEIAQFAKYDLVIDAIFGIGLSRDIEGKLAGIIALANGTDAWRVAVDISSGICADDGRVLGEAFRADDTVTFSFGKLGQFLWPGNEYSGRVHIVPMGITAESFGEERPKVAALDDSDLVLPKRSAHSNKGTYGKLLVIAGSAGMAGAACLCARAAYRSGCGLVRVLTAEENRIVLQASMPEAILTTYSEPLDEGLVADAVRWADAVVLGPGIGMDGTARALVRFVMKQVQAPLVLDADALNILAEDMEALRGMRSDVVVTPHLGEMARLTKKSIVSLQEQLCGSAEGFAGEFGVTCVLKDFHTVTATADGAVYLNLSGNPGMATAGSGDVLAGIVGSLLAQGMTAGWAAPLGVYLHGLAGDAAAEKVGMRALMAGDIVEGLAGLWV